MPRAPSVYGFPLQKATALSALADREITRQRKGPRTAFGQPIVSEGARAIQLWSTSGSPTIGDLISANAAGYHEGRLRFYGDGVETTHTIGRTCWLGLFDWEDADAGQVIGEHGRHYIAIPIGNVDVLENGDERPTYYAIVGEQGFIGKADSAIAKGDTGTISLYSTSSKDSTINKTAMALGAAIGSGKWCTVNRVRGGQWFAFPWECS